MSYSNVSQFGGPRAGEKGVIPLVSKKRLPLLAVFVTAFGLMGGALAQAEEGGPGGGGGEAPADPIICALTGGGEACSEEPSEPGQPGEPSEPGQPGEPSEPSPGEPSEPSPGQPSEPGQPGEPGGGEPPPGATPARSVI